MLTMELQGMGVVQCIDDMVAHLSSGLAQGPPQFRVLRGHHSSSFSGVLSVLFGHWCGGLPSALFGVVGGCGQRDGDTTSHCLALAWD